MASHAPAQIDDLAAEGVAELRAEKRSTSQKLDLSDPRQISKEVVVALARKVSPDLIADKINLLLSMTRQTKVGEVPDVRAMEAGIKLYLAYAVGLPTQRSEVLTVNVDADAEAGLAERLKSSPALRQVFRRMIDQIEGGNPESPAIDSV
jgi:hypothetical protein